MSKHRVIRVVWVAAALAAVGFESHQLLWAKGSPTAATPPVPPAVAPPVTDDAPFVPPRCHLPAPAHAQPVVQIALLLDTSNSMDGLIGQAKTQLWKIVNQFDKARHNGQRPKVQVALYHYGTPSLGSDNGFVRQLLGFTDDLDLVSEKLFALQTKGGDEYCGTVIQAAVRDLGWSNRPQDYRAVFIAGNEPFNQGFVDFRSSCADAVAKDIVVNTIFCGQNSEGIHTHWKQGADLTDGSYMSINQNAVAVHIDAPQDKIIIELNAQLNTTYLGYGRKAEEGAGRQVAQDENAAAAAPSSMLSRIATKSSSNYRNSSWDLVDAVRQGETSLETLKADDLPQEMRDMSVAQQKDYLDAKAKQRAQIQAKIRDLTAQRDAYVAQQRKQQANATDETLGAAMTEAIRQQAQKKNYTFEPEPNE